MNRQTFGRTTTQLSSTVTVSPQKGPWWPTASRDGAPYVVPFHILPGSSIWPTKQSSRNRDVTTVCLSVFLASLSLGGSHARSIPRETPTCWGSKTSCQWPCGAARKSILQPQWSLRVTPAPTDSMIAPAWNALSQNPSARLLLNSWPSQTLWDEF